MKKLVSLTILFLLSFTVALSPAHAESEANKPPCGERKTTVCTIELWLGHKQKKNNRDIRKFLKSKDLKVLRHTIQYWKPKGGHPPTNIAIGSRVSAEDARLVIDIAFKYNDNIERLILRPLNPPNYVAIGTSAWDLQSEILVSKEDLQRLRDPKLTTEEFQALYAELTHEVENVKKGAKFY
ncbi:MAG: hypothetical protein CMH80_06435 [Nitrospinae bacterium]|nr:hypothetical protein [Nitrospinota bacterium]